MISFWFNSKGKYKYETIEEIRANLSVKDEFNERKPLRMIDSNIGIDTLGVLLAPNRSMNEEF